MPNDSDGKEPADNAEQHAPSQPEVLAAAPEQGNVGKDAANGSDEQPTVAQEMRREFRWFEFGSLFVNIALAVIGVVALCIYNGQLGVMRGQLGEIIKQYPELQKSADAAKDAAKAAQDSVTLTRDSTRLDQRAWLTLRADSEKMIYPVGIHLLNIGRTPAKKVHIDIVVEVVPNGKAPTFDYTVPHNTVLYGTFFPQQQAETITGEICGTWGTQKGRKVAFTRNFTTAEQEQLHQGDAYLATYIRATYQDVFGEPHWIHYCAALISEKVTKFIDYKACTDYEDIDKEKP